MKKTALRRYARLIARVGANIQKGQEVVITCDLDQPEFVRICVDMRSMAGPHDRLRRYAGPQYKNRPDTLVPDLLVFMVGPEGFEPPTQGL